MNDIQLATAGTNCAASSHSHSWHRINQSSSPWLQWKKLLKTIEQIRNKHYRLTIQCHKLCHNLFGELRKICNFTQTRRTDEWRRHLWLHPTPYGHRFEKFLSFVPISAHVRHTSKMRNLVKTTNRNQLITHWDHRSRCSYVDNPIVINCCDSIDDVWRHSARVQQTVRKFTAHWISINRSKINKR